MFEKHHLPITFLFFFFNDTATTEIYTLSLHDALPISLPQSMTRGLLASSERKDNFSSFSQGVFATVLDRKSTRLNSSHSQISYAVFCLKKKNKKSSNTSDLLMTDNILYKTYIYRYMYY